MAEEQHKPVSLHDLKSKVKSLNNNLIGDGDYYLRDKFEEAKKDYPNTFDMTPPKSDAEIQKEKDDIQNAIDIKAKSAADAKILAEANAKRDLEQKDSAKDKIAKMNAAKQAKSVVKE